VKVSPRLKLSVHISFSVLYASGVFYFIVDRFLKVPTSLGVENNPNAHAILEIHAIVGLWFIALMGYLLRAHIEPGWRVNRNRGSGLGLFIPLLILCATVPGLYYLADEKWRAVTAFVHTYLGLVAVLPLLFHLWAAKRTRQVLKSRR
jgi:hypothetical protein